MKANIKVSPTTIVEVEGADIKELFRKRAEAEEVMGEKGCGLCEDTAIRYVVREVTTKKGAFSYFEAHCQNPGCRARLSYGQGKDMKSLFPKRRLGKNGEPDMENGTFGQHNGWSKFKGEPDDKE